MSKIKVEHEGSAHVFVMGRGLALGLAYVAILGLGRGWCEQPDRTLHAGTRLSSQTSESVGSGGTLRIHVDSDLVVIPVTVTDHKGRAVTGLQKKVFTIYEDKAEQTIAQFASEDVPVSMSIVLDTSDSMRPKLKQAREAAAALLNSANPQDEFSLLEFNHLARVTVAFTTQGERIRSQLANIQTGGATALLDAVRFALNQMQNAHRARKAIIIISDGEDNASRCSLKQLREMVRETDLVIYAIGITESAKDYQSWPPQSSTGSALLRQIARETGGRFFQAKGSNQLAEIASGIGAWLRNQYMLAYVPTRQQKDGKYHQIRIKISRPEGFPPLHADWRPGYYSPSE